MNKIQKKLYNEKKADLTLCSYCYYPTAIHKLEKCLGCGRMFCSSCMTKEHNLNRCNCCTVRFVKENVEVMFVK